MQPNYLLIALITIAAIILIIWLIRRNQKDKKDFEHDAGQSEIKPEKHEDEQGSI